MIDTTVGRVMFNEILPKGMPFYNIAMRSSELASVIGDCYEILGRRQTIELLDDMKQLGFRESTLSGLSFATDDLITPDTKGKIIGEAEKQVDEVQQAVTSAASSPSWSGTTQVLDAWTHAREQITDRDDGGARERLPRPAATSTRSS